MLILFSAVKKGLFLFSWAFFAIMTVLFCHYDRPDRWCTRHLAKIRTVVMTIRTVVIGMMTVFMAKSALKFPLNIWHAARLHFATGDSPRVKPYHIAGISILHQSNCTLFRTIPAPHSPCCQPERPKTQKESIQNRSTFRTK